MDNNELKVMQALIASRFPLTRVGISKAAKMSDYDTRVALESLRLRGNRGYVKATPKRRQTAIKYYPIAIPNELANLTRS